MVNDIWTIKAALDWTVGYLERKGDDNPRISAQWLLAEACGISRIELYMHLDQPLSMNEREILRGYVTRRGKGEPLQYITGSVGFRHIAVQVRPGVLIPRPETEVLVSEALALLPPAPRPRAKDDEEPLAADHGGDAAEVEPLVDDVIPPIPAEEPEFEPLLVADLCTGSGCIACSIAYEHPFTQVFASDIAPEAVTLARENAAALGLGERVSVIGCDLGEGIPSEVVSTLDLVVSNPPYVPTAVLANIPREVAVYEPELALDGGADGLDVFRRLLTFCTHALKPGGGFAFELHETCLDDAAALAAEAGFVDVRIVADLAGRPRVLVGRAAYV